MRYILYNMVNIWFENKEVKVVVFWVRFWFKVLVGYGMIMNDIWLMERCVKMYICEFEFDVFYWY